MIEHDFEHVFEEALLQIIVPPLALAYKEGLSINVSERTHLPNRCIGNGDQWLALTGRRQMVLEVPEGMS